jgi:hypothetical protein
MAQTVRNLVICRAPEDAALAGALHRELGERAIDAWPSGPEITAEYPSAELITRLAVCDGLVVLATPAAIAWPFALKLMRLARELSRPVLVLSVGLRDHRLGPWLAQVALEPDAIHECSDARAAASAIEHWSPPAPDKSPSVVQFAAARAELLRVASHGGRVAELAASGIDSGLLRRAALHLRAIGLIDFAGSLEDERTSFIAVG